MPHALRTHWLGRLRRLAWGLALLALAGTWSMVAYEIYESRTKHFEALGIRAETLAQVYGEVVRGQLQELDTALLLLREEVPGQDMARFGHLARLLKQWSLRDVALQFAVIGPEGMLRFTDLEAPRHPVDLKDRAHFRVHAERQDDSLYISEPLKGRVSQRWTVQLSRRLVGADGRFAGVLVLSIEPAALARMGKDLNLGDDHVLTLINEDRAVLSRFPEGDDYMGRRLAESPYLEAPYRAWRRPSLLDGQERMIAYQPVPGFPLKAGVSLSLAPTQARIDADLRQWLLLGSLFSLAIGLMLWGFLRLSRRQEAREGVLLQERQRLDEVLALTQFGRWERDLRTGKGRWSPEAYALFDYPPGNEPPDYASFLERVHPDDRPALEAALEACASQGTPFEMEHRLRRQDGSERILFARGYRELDADGQPACLVGVVLDVTESRRQQAQLLETEKRWQWGISAARDGVWDWHVSTGSTWFSPRWKSMLGYEPDELADSFATWRQLLNPEDWFQVQRVLDDYLAARTPFYEVEFRMRAKGGAWVWILARGQAVERDREGRPLRVMGTHTDITDRKSTELALKRERSRLADAQAVAQMGSWEWDIGSGRLWWSDETYRIFGLAPGASEPTYEGFLARVPAEDRDKVVAAIDTSLQDRIPYQIEHRLLRLDGGERIVQERGRVEYDTAGKPLRMTGTVQDITARKWAEVSLAESEARYRLLVAAMAEGLVVQDQDGRITFCNDAASKLLGLSRAQLLGRESLDPRWRTIREDGSALPGEEHPAMRALRTGQALDGEVMGVARPDGERIWLMVNARPLLAEGGGRPYGVVTTFADITTAKAAQLNSQLAEAVVHCTSQPIVVTDAEGFIVQANPAFCLLAGYRLDEVIGRPVGGVMHSGHQQPEFYIKLWAQLKDQGNWEGEVWNRRRTGEVVPQWLSITAIRTAQGLVERYVGIYMDITEHKRREENMWKAANYDHLTGQPNRLLFHDRLQAGLARARRLGTRLGVLFVDLDRFKQINDRYGHRAGDLVLQTVARRMEDCIREDDTLARIAGDEFMALLQNLGAPEQVEQVAAKLLQAAVQPIDIGGETVDVSCSIGYAVYPDDGDDEVTLVERADQAMYRVKEAGRNGVRRHQPVTGVSTGEKQP